MWAPDGKELYYIEGERLMAVPIDTDEDFSLGEARVVVEGTYRFGGYATDYDVAEDGRLLLVRDAEEKAAPPHLVVVDNWFQELTERVPVP